MRGLCVTPCCKVCNEGPEGHGWEGKGSEWTLNRADRTLLRSS